MENRKWFLDREQPVSHSLFPFPLSLFCASVALALTGCAAPGDPRPPQPVIPRAVGDLAAQQGGGNVVLTFTLPSENAQGDPLEEPPAVEIFRAVLPAGPVAQTKVKTQLIYTVPAALVETYLEEKHFRFLDPLAPMQLPPGAQLVYVVRTRAAKWRSSADSNSVVVRVFPPPDPPTGLRAVATEAGVELAWPPPATAPLGGAIVGYRVYRREVHRDAEPRPDTGVSGLALLGPSSGNSFRDASAEFGRTFSYRVSSIAQYETQAVESALSEPVEVAARDTFPPAAPKDLVAVVAPSSAGRAASVELSWGISSETDLAGYRVYRSEQLDTRGEPLNPELLPSPAFRDTSVERGRRYYYRVTAVDRAGNESPPGAAASAEVP